MTSTEYKNLLENIIFKYFRRDDAPKNAREMTDSMMKDFDKFFMEKPTPPSETQKEGWEQEFDKQFTIDPARTFFGDPEKLKAEGWEVGSSELMLKQVTTPAKIKDFIQCQRHAAFEAGYKAGVEAVAWRIECETLITELEGWKASVERGKEDALKRLDSHPKSFSEEGDKK